MNVSPSGQYVYTVGDIYNEGIFGNDSLYTFEVDYFFLARWQACYINTASTNEIPSRKNSIILYPNPNNGEFTLQANSQQPLADSYVEVYNMLGEKVYSTSYQPLANNYQLSLSNQPNGIYLYRVISENGALMGEGKFVIAH